MLTNSTTGGMQQQQHPYCNLTTNKQLSREKMGQAFYFTIPTAWLVVQIIVSALFCIFLLFILYDAVMYVLYQRRKNIRCSKIFFLYHYHLSKLILLLFVLLLRFIWLLEPYYYPASGKPQDRLFGDTFDDHATAAEFFLRIPQILLFLVLLLQIKSWRQTVRDTTNFKSRKSVIHKANTLSDSVGNIATRIDNIVIFTLMVVLILVSILTYALYPVLGSKIASNIYNFTAALYVLILIPSAGYYTWKIHKLILKMKKSEKLIQKNNDNTRRRTRKTRNAIEKVIRIQKCIIIIQISGFILLGTSIFRMFIDRCAKNQYVNENIKYLIYFVLVHAFCELSVCICLFYTLHMKRQKPEKKATDRTDGNKRVVFTTRNIYDSENPSTTLIVSDQEKTKEKKLVEFQKIIEEGTTNPLVLNK